MISELEQVSFKCASYIRMDYPNSQVSFVKQNKVFTKSLKDIEVNKYTTIPAETPNSIYQKIIKTTKVHFQNAKENKSPNDIAHSNNVKFDYNYDTLSYDIETVDPQHEGVPLCESESARITMIQFVYTSEGQSVHHIYTLESYKNLHNLRDTYFTNHKDQNLTINMTYFKTDIDMCQTFMDSLSELTKMTLVYGFNSNSSMAYGKSEEQNYRDWLYAKKNLGYDLPFIVSRSGYSLKFDRCSQKCGNQKFVQDYFTTALPFCLFLDTKVLF